MIRENMLRLAAYRWFKQALKDGQRVYGASKPAEIDAIDRPDDKAAKLARELIGDYGNISSAGQYIRRRLIPFYSWMEINMPALRLSDAQSAQRRSAFGRNQAAPAAWPGSSPRRSRRVDLDC